ncbi:MAG: M15 family metallopeptidase [Moraxella sp.]|nr:M15 family metallopeptidase [Moraxella sp.]
MITTTIRSGLMMGLMASTAGFAGVANCLTHAYPDITSVSDGQVKFKNGKTLPLGTVSTTSFTTRLNNASIADQLSQTYPLDFVVPKQYQDAGRLRNDAFFKALYGANEKEVRANMTQVVWRPSGKTLLFNKRNNASIQLQKVGDEIAKNKELSAYVSKSLGTLNWRVIAGTNRLSSHSFGVAVDFHLPKHLHKYWRWDGCTSEDKVCPYPKALLGDPKLQQVVKIFEKHGFIWGGKWTSYDSPHFEYRPELLIRACRSFT